MKPSALAAGALLVLLYLGACALAWHEQRQNRINPKLCPLCGETANP
jgi:hypothetical protein